MRLLSPRSFLLPEGVIHEAVQLVERFADGRIQWSELKALPERIRTKTILPSQAYNPGVSAAVQAVRSLGRGTLRGVETGMSDALALAKAGCRGDAYWAAVRVELAEQVILLHDIFGNPFHPSSICPSVFAWNGGLIRLLAKDIYDERGFDRMPILADAPEEAGCTDADILNHCRQPVEHLRGYWVVDLLLGKS